MMSDPFGNPSQHPNPQQPGTPPAPPAGSPFANSPGQTMPPQGAPRVSMPGQGPQPTIHPQWQTSEGPEVAHVFTDPVRPGQRILARILDTLAVLAILFPAMILLSPLLGIAFIFITQETMDSKVYEFPIWVQIIATLAWYIPIYLNEVVLTANKGGNLGKLLLNLRIVDAETRDMISFNQANKRFLVFFVPMIIVSIVGILIGNGIGSAIKSSYLLWLVLIYFSIVLSPPLFQGFHDKFSKTTVVKKVPKLP